MDSSAASPDEDTSVFTFAETSVEPMKTGKIRTSVSVSSLTEKFEKGSESSKGEEKENIEYDLVSKEKLATEAASGTSVKTNDASHSCLKKENAEVTKHMENVSDILLDMSVSYVPHESTSMDDSNSPEMDMNVSYVPQASASTDDVNSAAKDMNVSYVPQPSTSATDVNSQKIKYIKETETQISNAVEERVAYFAEKISQSLQNSMNNSAAKSEPSACIGKEAGKSSVSTQHDVKYKNVANQISLKDLEQSFVTALNLANAAGAKKTVGAAVVPSIKITEASDLEETSSDIAEETILETEVKIVNKMEESDTKPTNDNIEEPTPSTSTDVQFEKTDESEVSQEERKAFFYISSSDLPGQPLNKSIENSEIQQQAECQDDSTEPDRTQQSERKKDSCLCSKYFHGAVLLASFVVAVFGFILYNMAHEGTVPDFCESLGIITAIAACIIGAFSCFCFSFLEAFPRVPVAMYERLVNTEAIPPANGNLNGNIQTLVEGSWSPETERAFRRQNGMSSSRTSEASVRSRQSDPRELIEKTEKLKKEVVGLLDSFTEMMSKLQPVDELAEMESGRKNELSDACVNTNEV